MDEENLLNAGKVYCFYCDSRKTVGRFEKITPIGSHDFFELKGSKDDLASQRKIFLRVSSVSEIIEFNSDEDYENFLRWEKLREKKH